jgi:phage tail-like protein
LEENNLVKGKVQDKNWPLPNFFFKVELGEDTYAFKEISGLDAEVETTTYRHGNSRQKSDFIISSRPKFNDVTLKKGLFTKDTKLYSWFKSNLNSPDRKDVSISLMNELNNKELTWKLISAFPKKITFSDFNSQESGIAIETVVLSCEDLDFISI